MDKLAHKRIAVLKGGPGSERDVSLASAAGVAKALRSLGAEVCEVDVRDAGFELPEAITVAFNVVHGTFGEDGQLQEILEKRGVAYTGEGAEESRLAFDKIETKKTFAAQNIPTPPFEVVSAGDRPSMELPYVVKAPREGSSVGVYIAKTADEGESALRDVVKYGREFLVEKYIAGRELTVGIIGALALPVIEICPRKGFYDFKNKYPFLDPQRQGAATHLCPAPLDAHLTRLVQETALRAHRALGLVVYSRVDVILTEAGQPFVLEINTIPGMTQASLLPEAAAAAGIGYPALCERIIELSLSRQARQ